MFDFTAADQQISQRPQLIEALVTLSNLIFDKKKFVFIRPELDFDLTQLEEEGVLEVIEDKVLLKDHNLLYYVVYIEFARKLSFSVSNDVKTLFEFLRSIRDHFDLGNHNGISKFLRGVNMIALFYQHVLYTSDVLSYSKEWNNRQESPLFIFTEAFGQFLPYQQFEIEYLLNLLRNLYLLNE